VREKEIKVIDMNPKQYHAYAIRQLAQILGIDPDMKGRDIKSPLSGQD
jgi:hypothetical protein